MGWSDRGYRVTARGFSAAWLVPSELLLRS